MKTLFLSPLQHQRKGGVGGGGGGCRGGIPASFPSRSPPPKQPFQPTPTPSPGSRQEVCEKIVIWVVWVVFVGKRPQAPGGPGPKPWAPGPQAPWRPGPQAPGPWIPPLRLKPMGGSQNATITPNPLTLGVVSEGGAVQFHERRGSRLCSSISAAGPGPKPLETWPTSPSALHAGQEFQKCPGAHRLMKSLACCTD